MGFATTIYRMIIGNKRFFSGVCNVINTYFHYIPELIEL
jgi:hypothetical protein